MCFCAIYGSEVNFKKKRRLLPAATQKTELTRRPDGNLFLKFQNNFTAEFWVTFSYGLLLQRFFWNSSGIFIMSIKADTRNFSKKYQHFFLLDAIFFEQKGPFKPYFSKIYLPSMKSEYFVLLSNDICCSLQSFSAIALKTKKLWRKLRHS